MVIKHKNNSPLTKNEKKRIFLKKERKKSLKILLSPSLEIRTSSLELGYVTLTNTGFVIHCVQFAFKNEIFYLCCFYDSKTMMTSN